MANKLRVCFVRISQASSRCLDGVFPGARGVVKGPCHFLLAGRGGDWRGDRGEDVAVWDEIASHGKAHVSRRLEPCCALLDSFLRRWVCRSPTCVSVLGRTPGGVHGARGAWGGFHCHSWNYDAAR